MKDGSQTMDCERARKLMSLVSGSDVTEDTRASVLAHAEACTACRAELEAYRRAAEALATVQDVPEPPGGWGGIWAGIAEHLDPVPADPAAATREVAPRVVRPAGPRWRPALARLAASLLVGFSAGFTVYHLAYSPVPSSPPETPDHLAKAGAPERGSVVQPPAPVSSSPSAGVPTLPAAILQDRLGVEIVPHPQPGKGWTVMRIQPGSPAFVSGLRPDDVLQSLNGAVLPPSAEELDSVIRRHLEQAEVRLRFLRGTAEQEAVVKLQQRLPGVKPQEPDKDQKP
jgi:hypothetical protein